MDIFNFLSIILVIIIVVAIIIILVKINKNLKKRIDEEKSKFLYYNQEIEKLQKENPTEKDLEQLNKLARNFFRLKYDLSPSLTYLELYRKFNKLNKQPNIRFCKSMSILFYKKEKIKPEEIKKVINLFLEILKTENKPDFA